MFNYNHYVPILKGKKGELEALSELNKSVKEQLTPLIDIPQVDTDFDTGKPKKSLSTHLSNTISKIKTSWGVEQAFFLDLFDLKPSDRVDNGIHPLTYIFDLMRSNNIKAIPTTGFDRDEAHNEAVAKTISADERGVCIRLLTEDVENVKELGSNIIQMLQTLKVPPGRTHILMDFKELKHEDIKLAAKTVVSAINNVNEINNYASLTIAATGFPGSLSEVGTQTTMKIQRTELFFWKTILNQSNISRVPTFGDYGIANPVTLDLDWRIIPLIANIRYTLEKEWLIIRGKDQKKYGGKQGYQLSKILIKSIDYYSPDYCWGDRYISDCAKELVGPGSLTTWRKIGTNHHLTLVSEQIANTVLP